jgi:hypothetical protein
MVRVSRTQDQLAKHILGEGKFTARLAVDKDTKLLAEYLEAAVFATSNLHPATFHWESIGILLARQEWTAKACE